MKALVNDYSVSPHYVTITFYPNSCSLSISLSAVKAFSLCSDIKKNPSLDHRAHYSLVHKRP